MTRRNPKNHPFPDETLSSASLVRALIFHPFRMCDSSDRPLLRLRLLLISSITLSYPTPFFFCSLQRSAIILKYTRGNPYFSMGKSLLCRNNGKRMCSVGNVGIIRYQFEILSFTQIYNNSITVITRRSHR